MPFGQGNNGVSHRPQENSTVTVWTMASSGSNGLEDVFLLTICIDHIVRIWSGGKVAVKGEDEWADRVLRFAYNGVRGDNDVDV